MSIAQTIAQIMQQEAQQRGQIGVAKAGLWPQAIGQSAEGLQGALNQIAQNRTRGLQQRGMEQNLEMGGIELGRAKRGEEYEKRKEAAQREAAARAAQAPNQEEKTRIFVEWAQQWEPKAYREMVEEARKQRESEATIEEKQASAMKSRVGALQGLEEKPEYVTAGPGVAVVRKGAKEPDYVNPALPGRESTAGTGQTRVIDKGQGPRVYQFNLETGEYDKDLGKPQPSPVIRDTSGLTPYQRVSQETGLRKEFNSSPAVKEYDSIRQQMARVESAIEQSKTSKNFVAIDQALINGLNKMIDPNSVVREGEYARTIQNSPLFNRILGKVDQVRSGGGGFTTEERSALVSLMRDFNRDAESLYQTHASEYERLAEGSGIDPKRIVVRRDVVQPKGKAAAPAAATGAIKVKRKSDGAITSVPEAAWKQLTPEQRKLYERQ